MKKENTWVLLLSPRLCESSIRLPMLKLLVRRRNDLEISFRHSSRCTESPWFVLLLLLNVVLQLMFILLNDSVLHLIYLVSLFNEIKYIFVHSNYEHLQVWPQWKQATAGAQCILKKSLHCSQGSSFQDIRYSWRRNQDSIHPTHISSEVASISQLLATGIFLNRKNGFHRKQDHAIKILLLAGVISLTLVCSPDWT